MSQVNEILLQLEAKGIDVFLEGEKLKARGRKGALDSDAVALIKSNKSRLSEYLRASFGSSTHGRPPVVAVPRNSNRVPLSFAQQRMWSLDRLAGGSPHYNMPLALR